MASSLPPRAIPPAQSGQHTPAAILVTVEPLSTGGYRLSTVHARGWAHVAKTPHELARAMALAFNEVQVAAYARAHSNAYDLDAMTPQVSGDPLAGNPVKGSKRVRRARANHHPADWQMVSNGSWRSPSGRIYGAGTQVVERVVANRQALGLPVT